jgi:hypothetical protein
MKPGEMLIAGVAGLPSAGAVAQVTSLLCSTRGDTGCRRWSLPVAAAVSCWAIVTAVLAVLAVLLA